MSTRTELRIIDVAQQIRAAAHARTLAIQDELHEIDAQKAAKETELRSVKRGLKRTLSFSARIGPDHQCPRCWIENGERSALYKIPGTTWEDFFRCRCCGLEITVLV